MIELLFVVFVVLFSIKTKNRENIILLLILLLPFNDVLKKIIASGGGNLFAFWKELAIFILFFRSFYSIRIKKAFPFYIILLIYFSFFFLIGSDTYGMAISFRNYRNILILPLLVYSFSSFSINDVFLKKIVLCIVISSTIIAFSGIIEIHFGYREVIRRLMGSIETESETGYIYYSSSNYKIMGFDRMCGIINTPNQFGYFMALNVALLYYLFQTKVISLNKVERKILISVLILLFICLLESFCRTGYALLFFIYIFSASHNKKLFNRIIILFLLLISIILVISMYNSSVHSVLMNTFGGNEASAADRSNNLARGINYLYNNPFGSGLGSSENSTSKCVFFSESSFVNLGVEAGIIGIILFVSFNLFIIKYMNNNNPFKKFSFSVCIANLMTFIFANTFGTPSIYYIWLFIALGYAKFEQKINSDLAKR